MKVPLAGAACGTSGWPVSRRPGARVVCLRAVPARWGGGLPLILWTRCDLGDINLLVKSRGA